LNEVISDLRPLLTTVDITTAWTCIWGADVMVRRFSGCWSEARKFQRSLQSKSSWPAVSIQRWQCSVKRVQYSTRLSTY